LRDRFERHAFGAKLAADILEFAHLAFGGGRAGDVVAGGVAGFVVADGGGTAALFGGGRNGPLMPQAAMPATSAQVAAMRSAVEIMD